MTLDQTRPIADPNATTSPPQVELVGSVPTPPMPDPSETMTIHVTLPPAVPAAHLTDTPGLPSATSSRAR